MMGGWNLHIQELYVLDYQLLSKETGGGAGGGCVLHALLAWLHGSFLLAIEDAGPGGPTLV